MQTVEFTEGTRKVVVWARRVLGEFKKEDERREAELDAEHGTWTDCRGTVGTWIKP